MRLNTSLMRVLPAKYRVPAMAAVLVIAVGIAVVQPDTAPAAGPGSTDLRVIDGDTIVLDGDRVRIIGMDACEMGQRVTSNGRSWDCGEVGKARLEQLIGSNPVRCDGDERDVYGRLLARCFVGEMDLGRQLVAEGLAVVYYFRNRPTAPELVDVEAQAREAGLGLWSADDAVSPGDYRRGRR